MPYQIAGIDVHKRMLAVVVADIEVEGEYQFEQRKVYALGNYKVFVELACHCLMAVGHETCRHRLMFVGSRQLWRT